MDLLPALMRETGDTNLDRRAGKAGVPLQRVEGRIVFRFHRGDDPVIRIILLPEGVQESLGRGGGALDRNDDRRRAVS